MSLSLQWYPVQNEILDVAWREFVEKGDLLLPGAVAINRTFGGKYLPYLHHPPLSHLPGIS